MSILQATFKTDEHEIFIDKLNDHYIVEVYENRTNLLRNKAVLESYGTASMYVNELYLKGD